MVTGAQGKNNILVQKPGAHAPEKSSLKKADRSFERELEKTQKKAPKRKEEEVAAQESPHQNSQQPKTMRPSDKSESQGKPVAKVDATSPEKSSPLITNGMPQDIVEGEIQGMDGILPQSTPTKDLLDLNVTQSEIMNIENPVLEGTEGIDISQMEAVSPQEVSEFADLLKLNESLGLKAQPSVEGAAENTSILSQDSATADIQVGALDSSIGNKEENLKDFSQDEQNLAESLADVRADQIGVQNKDKITDQFSKVLEAKASEMTQVQQKENSDAVVTNVRTMIKDGGGEMVMKLTPEGMGTIDLKVGVDAGVVSIEMKADNAEIKRALENNLSEIRTALEGQNLKIETVKVDVSDSFKDMQNNNPNQMDQQFARNFLGQFRDDRQAFRQQTMGMELERFPTSANGPQGLHPAQTRPAGNGRLNVVA
ncbi:MAG: flagellar hook-length control protein FliK [Bdellovibrionales bacterium]|nr:flagellar hook-length control protein FliK [Bdellovibrionales bacterium]